MTNPAVGVLSFLRSEWATRFVDSCIVKRESGASFNSTTGVTTPTYSTVYDGGCLVRPGLPGGAEFGEERVESRRPAVFIPYNSDDVLVGDLVDVTSTRDGILDGKTLTVRNVSFDTYNTRRMIECEDHQRG